MALKRINKEHADLTKNPLEGIDAGPEGDDCKFLLKNLCFTEEPDHSSLPVPTSSSVGMFASYRAIVHRRLFLFCQRSRQEEVAVTREKGKEKIISTSFGNPPMLL